MERRIPIYAISATVLVVIIILIAGVTIFASNTIGRTVLDQFTAQQLQLVTSVSQQTESYFSEINIEIINLSQNGAIRSASNTDERIQNALNVIRETARNRPELVSVTRFSYDGVPRYAWPESRNNLIQNGNGRYPVELPDNLVELATTATENREAIEIDTQLHYYPALDTYLLIKGVNPTGLQTEFIVYEINLTEALTSRIELVIEDVRDSDTGQLWIMDMSTETPIVQIRNSPNFDTIQSSLGETFLNTIDEPENRTYTIEDTDWEASITGTTALDQRLIFILTRETDEAQSIVQGDLNLILAIAIGATVVIFVAGAFATNRLIQETRQRREEAGLRRTSRALLEISRALNATLDLDTVLNRILLELQNLIPYYSASVLLMSEEGLSVAAHRGADERSHEKGSFSIDEARAAREVMNTGRPVIIPNTEVSDLWTDMPESTIRSWLGLPLRVFDRYVGVLNINSDQIDYFSKQDMEVAETLADQASVALQNARRHEAEVKRIEQELTVAKGIQNSLLPTQESVPSIPQLEIAFESVAARQVSGDFFQLIELANGYLGIVVGDVTGKGMPAALIMAVITTALRDEITRHRDPGELLNVLNTRLLDRLLQNKMNGALITAIFNPRTRDLSIANAGMVQPYIWLPEANEWDWIDVGGYPLGASQHANYRGKVLHFSEKGLLVMFSDGIIEAQNAGGEFFGFERLEDLLETMPAGSTAHEIRDRILQAVSDHLGDEVNQDDVTIMVIRSIPEKELKAAPEPVAEQTLAAAVAPPPPVSTPVDSASVVDTDTVAEDTEEAAPAAINQTPLVIPDYTPHLSDREVYIMPRDNVELFLPSTLGYEKVARNAAAAIAREMGFSEDRINDLMTAVAEACMNAIEHGNQQDRSTSVTVLLSSTEERLDIRVEDRGRKTIPDPLPPPGGSDKSRGWGIFFIQTLMDEVEITRLPEGGNLVKMTIYMGPDESEDDDEFMVATRETDKEKETPTTDASDWVESDE